MSGKRSPEENGARRRRRRVPHGRMTGSHRQACRVVSGVSSPFGIGRICRSTGGAVVTVQTNVDEPAILPEPVSSRRDKHKLLGQWQDSSAGASQGQAQCGTGREESAPAAINPGSEERKMRGTATKSKDLAVQWEELTASDFPDAVKRSQGVCVLPIGVVEKHGPHLPLGTDTMIVRAAALGAAKREYVVVFPEYYFGQISEARHQPGCITIPPELLSPLLQGVCDSIARNGFRKILIVNGHGGNNEWLFFFCQTQLAQPRDFVLYYAIPEPDPELAPRIKRLRKTDWGGHADEEETSRLMALHPELVQLERAGQESGVPLKRLAALPALTAVSWYADHPHHFAGIVDASNVERGKLELESSIRGLVAVYQAVKKDTVARTLQDEFFARSAAPLKPAVVGGRR